MTKHIIDRARAGEGDRTKPYLDIERTTGGPGQREKALQRATASGSDAGQRMREFLRIEREAE